MSVQMNPPSMSPAGACLAEKLVCTMDESLLLIGAIRALAMTSLVVLCYSKVIKAFKTTTAANCAVGVLFAVAAIISMTDPIILEHGVIYDGRVPMLALSYAYSGPLGAFITVIAVSAYRLYIGGAGALPGLLGIFLAMIGGTIASRIRPRQIKHRLSRSTMIGLGGSLSALAVFTLPDQAYAGLSLNVVLIIIAANILATIVLNDFLSNERKHLSLFRALEIDAAIDPLTRLDNRRSFDSKAEQALSADANPSGEYAVLMIDIDHFKAVNDTYGHDVGDRVLANVADIVSQSVRKNDIVARFGGEEIAVLLPGTAGSKAARIAENIRERIEANEFLITDGRVRVTVSAGAAGAFSSLSDVAMALKAADQALYAAKRGGRNKVEIAA